MERTFGVHSEVGQAAGPSWSAGRAWRITRLTPGNCHDLLFDDVIWVQEAQKDHYDFVLKMQQRGVEVLDLHDLLAETLADTGGACLGARSAHHREHRRPRASRKSVRPWLDEMPAAKLVGSSDRRHRDRRPAEERAVEPAAGRHRRQRHSCIPPIPNTLFQRDPSCWIYGGVTCNPMYWPARKPETLLQRAVYKFHPDFKGGDFKIWFGDSDEDFTGASMEGGDVMAIGNGVVLIGMGERTTHQAVGQVAARALQAQGRRAQVIACVMPKSRAAMHLDTVFSLLRPRCLHDLPRGRRSDRAATASIPTGRRRHRRARRTSGRMLDVVKDALGLNALRVIETGGNAWQAEREQWDDGNNVVALEPGVVVGLRPQHLHQHPAAQGRHRGDHGPRLRARPRSRRRPLHDLPDLARARLLSRARTLIRRADMSFNLRNRSLLTVQDFTQREFQLPARSRARPEARQIRAHRAAAPEGQGDRPDLREDLDPHALRLRGRLPRPGRARHLSRSVRLADRPQGIGQGHRPRARPHVRRDRVPRLSRRRRSKISQSTPACPVFNGLTDEYHPTQMLADVMTMREHSDKPVHEIKYAYLGDTRSNMGHSLMIVGCLMGMDVRICGPQLALARRRLRQDRARPGGEVRRAS